MRSSAIVWRSCGLYCLAKLWALRDGLMLCINQNLERVEVELDARAIIDVISNLNNSNLFVHSLVDDCRLLASHIPRIHFKHRYREANRCAGLLEWEERKEPL